MALGSIFVEKSTAYAGQFSKVQPGERHKTVLLTWSHTGSHAAPSGKADGLRRVGDALEAIKKEKKSPVDLEQCGVAVFEEPHLSGENHLHIVVDFPAKCTVGSYVGEFLLREDVCVDVRAFKGASGCTPSIGRMLNYCMVPTEEKWLVDTAPLLYNMEIPVNVTDAAEKAARRLAKKPAAIDDLYNFLAGRPDVKTPSDLDRLLNAEIEKKGVHKHRHLPYTRLRLLASKLGQSFPAEFQSQRSRLLSLRVDPAATYSSYFSGALGAECVCKESGRLQRLLREGVLFHDSKEYYDPAAEFGSSRERLGAYYDCLVRDEFPARQQCLVICGEMGSGKTVVAQQHMEIFPSGEDCDLREAFVFKPALGDSFPFTGIPPMAKFVDLNDFRTTVDGVPPSLLLNLAEYATAKVAQKGAAAVAVRARVAISANYLSAGGLWKQEDLDALLGRKGRTFGGVISWKHPLPTHQQCGSCRHCSASFMNWCISAALSKSQRPEKKPRLRSDSGGSCPSPAPTAGFDEP